MNARWPIIIACTVILTGCAGMQNPKNPNLIHCTNQFKAHKVANYPLALQEGDLCLQKNTLSASLQSLVYAVQADAYSNLKRFPEAVVAKEKSMQLDGKPSPRDNLDLSAMYRDAGNPKRRSNSSSTTLITESERQAKAPAFTCRPIIIWASR